MKIRRFLLTCLGWAAALAVLLVLVEFFPNAQTWTAQLYLARRPDLHASLDRVAAGFGRVEVDNLKLTLGRAVLTLPEVRAHLPVSAAIVERRLAIRSLVARGWTLDLGGAAANAATAPAGSGPASAVPPKPARRSAGREAAAARNAVLRVLEALRTWVLPCDLSLNDVDIEGDIVNSPTPDGMTTRVHVVVKGGGLAPRHEGLFTVDVRGEGVNVQLATTTYEARGQVRLAMKTPRTFGRVATDGNFSFQGGPFPEGIVLSAKGAAALGPRGETCSLEVSRGDRHLATVHADIPGSGGRVTGTWELDLQDSELAAFLPRRVLPHFAASGQGRFDTDPAFSEIHAVGRLQGTLARLGVIAPALERLGTLHVDTRFDADQRGRTLQVHALETALTGSGRTAVVKALQAFDVDEGTGALRPAKPAGDWLDLSVRGLPRAWLTGSLAGFAVTGSDATGDFIIRTAKGGFTLKSKGAFVVTGASLARADRPIGRGLQLSTPLEAAWNPHGWNVRAASVSMDDDDGANFGRVSLKIGRTAGADQPITVAGEGKVELKTPAFKQAFPSLAAFGGRSATGDFSATLNAATELKGHLSVAGRTTGHSATASLQLHEDEDGRLSFTAPVRIAEGKAASDVSIQGTLISAEFPPFLYLKVSGKKADLGQLRLLAAAVKAAGGVSPPPATAEKPPGTAARVPFWGGWNGRVTVELSRLTAGNLNFDNLAGILKVNPQGVRLEEGRGALDGHRFRKIKAALTFATAAAQPYGLEAAADFDPIEASTLVSATTADGSPLVEGKFSVAATLTGHGSDPADLLARLQGKARLVSTTGIIRVLATNVDEAMPKDKDSVAVDALGRVGSAFGSFVGIRGQIGPGTRKVSIPLQDAINVVNQTGEIGYDNFTVTAVREPGGAIRLENLSVVAGDQRITGSGQIASARGLPLRKRPLHLELQYGVRGWYAKLMASADLLSSRKGAHGYTLLKEPLVIGGTLAHPDNRQWHEMLVKSAERAPAKKEKKSEKRR